MLNKELVVFDLETTGINPEQDEIIEIGAVRISRGEIVEKASWLVRPGIPLPKIITELTGITDEMLADKPSLQDTLPEIESFILGADLVAHNINFDVSFLSRYIPQINAVLHIDTLDLAKIVLPCAANYTLENLVYELNIPVKQFHRAGDDAELTAQVFLELYTRACSQNLDALITISKIFNEDSPLKIFFEKALKDRVKNSTIGEEKNFLKNLQLTVKPMRDEDEAYKLDETETLSWYTETSPLKSHNTYFEVRKPQITMVKAVVEAFNNQKHVVIEAGTGTGKSLAYLLPAAKYALHSGRKVVIATNTISLQEQLLTKDIPQLECLDLELVTALVKGRSHYLCLRKLMAIDDYKDLTHEEALALAKIYSWLNFTITGDKSEMNYSPKANSLWRQVCNDAEGCLGSKCKYYARKCFFWHARRQAELADLLIINHALLLSDCSSDKKVLPDFSHLIIDEAHHLDKVASEYLGGQCDFIDMGITLQRLIATSKNEGYSVLGKIRKQLLGLSDHEQLFAVRLQGYIEEIFNINLEVKNLLEAIRQELLFVLPASFDSKDFRQTYRIKQEHIESLKWAKFFEQGLILVDMLSAMSKSLYKFQVELDDFPNELGEKEQWQLETTNFSQYLKECVNTLLVFFKQETLNEIKWIEYDNALTNTFLLRCVPFDIGNILKTSLYERCETVIFTSATLTVAKNFDYYVGNIGLNLLPEKYTTVALGSVFNYQEQALVTVPSNIGNPQLNEIKFLDSTIEFLETIYQRFQGRTLVLFTSHKQLRYVYENINLPEKTLLLAQNISGSRKKLLETFCNHSNSCMLGANTFWEGIDLPGDLLNLLVIVKLPFLPPNNPVLEAKVERVERSGENAFDKVTLPGAVIRFKQGFGRLIRRTSDKGAVIILDNRIISKKYGFTFLKSLPIKTFFTSTSDEVIEKIVDWLH